MSVAEPQSLVLTPLLPPLPRSWSTAAPPQSVEHLQPYFCRLWVRFHSENAFFLPSPQHLENFTLVSSGKGQPFLDGKGQCPFDPQHTYTALLVGEYGVGSPQLVPREG